MSSCYWGSCGWAPERHDPSLPYLEQYRIDALQFAQLFSALAPWACSSHTSTLSARLFRLLDQNQDGLVNFKEFITGLSESTSQFCPGFLPQSHRERRRDSASVGCCSWPAGTFCSSGLARFCSEALLCAGGMYHGDMTDKLKLLYKLHLPQGQRARV